MTSEQKTAIRARWDGFDPSVHGNAVKFLQMSKDVRDLLAALDQYEQERDGYKAAWEQTIALGHAIKDQRNAAETSLNNLRSLIRSEAGHIAYVDDHIDELIGAVRAEERQKAEASLTQLHAAQGRLREALENIALYPLPVFTDDGNERVPLENADYLRTMAKEALAALSTPALTPQEDDLSRGAGVPGSPHGDLPRRAEG